MLRRTQHQVEDLIKPIIAGLGLQWVGLQFTGQRGQQPLLRLFLDKEAGFSIDDCVTVSRQIYATLGVAGIPRTDYFLEVSSPGLDRLFFNAAQCASYLGQMLRLHLRVPIENKKSLKGYLVGVEGQTLELDIEGQVQRLNFDQTTEVRLVPDYTLKQPSEAST